MADLVLALKSEYFNQIKSGEKREEFRLFTPYWRQRIQGKTFDKIVLTLGYPAADDLDKRLFRKWAGYRVRVITHPHFGDHANTVFAIDVSEPHVNPADAP